MISLYQNRYPMAENKNTSQKNTRAFFILKYKVILDCVYNTNNVIFYIKRKKTQNFLFSFMQTLIGNLNVRDVVSFKMTLKNGIANFGKAHQILPPIMR